MGCRSLAARARAEQTQTAARLATITNTAACSWRTQLDSATLDLTAPQSLQYPHEPVAASWHAGQHVQASSAGWVSQFGTRSWEDCWSGCRSETSSMMLMVGASGPCQLHTLT